MSILHMDGFEVYSNNGASFQSRYTVNNTSSNIGVTAGRFGGQCLNFANFTTLSIIKALGASYSTVVMGIAFASGSGNSTLGSVASGGTPIFKLLNSSSAVVAQLSIDVNGAVRWGRTDNTTNNVGTSANGVILGTPFQYIEVILTRHATAGAVQVWVDGVQVINVSGVNTGAADIANVSLHAHGGNNTFKFDDWYIANSATRIGERRVETLVPNADTATKNFTPNAGTTNFTQVDELPHNGDTDYVSSSTPGAVDLYDLSALSSTPTTIDAVQVVSEIEKDDALTRTARNKISSGGTIANGATVAALTTYAFQADLFETDPATSAAWTAAGVNALQAGVEVVA